MHWALFPTRSLPTSGAERMRRPMRDAQTGLRMNGLHAPVNAAAAQHLLPTPIALPPIARDL